MFQLFHLSINNTHQPAFNSFFDFVISNLKELINYLAQVNNISWQIVFLIFIYTFREEIKHFVKNIKNISVNGTSVSANVEKEQKEQHDKVVLSKKEAKNLADMLDNNKKTESTLKAQLHFERTYRLIFDSQLHILNIILVSGSLSKTVAQAIHRRTLFSNSYPFKDYINFLMSAQLIHYEHKSDSYILTELGLYFIKYLENNSIAIRKTIGSDLINIQSH